MATPHPALTGQLIDYPETDGKPMAESDVHRQALGDTIATLTEYFRDRPDVYVSGNLMMYYEEGNPSASVAPDVFVADGVPKGLRRTYKLWEEGQPPRVVIEFTSRSTALEDGGNKRFIYAWMGVQEYILCDPLHEYLSPPLQGFQLQDGDFERMALDDDGGLTSLVLGLRLLRENGRLRLIDQTTGERLLWPDEQAAARKLAEKQALDEAAARRDAETRLAETQTELERLRAELARLRDGSAQSP